MLLYSHNKDEFFCDFLAFLINWPTGWLIANLDFLEIRKKTFCKFRMNIKSLN